MTPCETGRVVFIGAGPGDPDLITVRGREMIAAADMILYAGSLVSPEILNWARADAEVQDSAGMELERQVALLTRAAAGGKLAVRLHTGDPSIFGAIDEQMRALEEAGVPYEIVPGVSSAFAAAAALGIEYTLPEITQTLIMTRAGGRTPVPEAEKLRELARHRCSLAIFLSTGLTAVVANELLAAGYPLETPVAVVYRASWPDQKVVRGTLAEIAARVEEEELTHQGLIVVSPALRPQRAAPSHLYGAFQRPVEAKEGTAVIALTAPSAGLARKLFTCLPQSHLYLPERLLAAERDGRPGVHGFRESIRQVLQDAFRRHSALVCVMASGIVARELAPLLKNKHSDPAVVVMDPAGKYAVSLIGGHEGGANRLAKQLAAITGGQAVITTASDDRGIPALDILARERGWVLHPRSRLASVMTAMVDADPVALVMDGDLTASEEISDHPWGGKFSHWHAAVAAGFSKIVLLTCRQVSEDFWRAAPDSAVYFLPALSVGLGCNRGAGCGEIMTAVQDTLTKTGLAFHSVDCLATIRDKADEGGLIEACALMDLELKIFERDQIREVKDLPTPSEAAMNALGVQGVAEPAAMLAARVSSLLVRKQKFANVTVAIALREGRI